MLARGSLQLGLDEALEPIETLRFTEQCLQWPGLAQQCRGLAGWRGTTIHDETGFRSGAEC